MTQQLLVLLLLYHKSMRLTYEPSSELWQMTQQLKVQQPDFTQANPYTLHPTPHAG